MANTFNYVSVYEKELLEIILQNTLTSPFLSSNVKFMNAKSFHFTQMAVTGFKNHSRTGGFAKGELTQTDNIYQLTHDRSISFAVDVADIDETNTMASIYNISSVFEQTQVAPEQDALFFSKVAGIAQANSLASVTAPATYTKANVLSKLKDILSKAKLRRYRAQGALIVYVSSYIMNLLEQSTEIQKTMSVQTIAENGGIETRCAYVDGTPIFECIDSETFYDKFDFNSADGGFDLVAHTAEVTGSRPINILVASPISTKIVNKINNIYLYEPGSSPDVGDSYVYAHRQLSDVFVFPNGKDNKIDSIYVDVSDSEYTGA